MLTAVLISALLSQPIDVQYQIRSFENEIDESGVESGQLDSAQLACVAAFLPALHPTENPADLLTMRYARQEQNRDNACIVSTVERSLSSGEFAALEIEPQGAYFSVDGTTAHWRERLPTQCVDRDSLDGLNACISAFGGPPGRFTEWYVSRDNTTIPAVLQYLWEVRTGPPLQYGLDRAARVARSHIRELPPVPESP